MQTVCVKFATEADRARGFYELIRQTCVRSFPGQVYEIPCSALEVLDALRIGYRQATDQEAADARLQASLKY